MKKHFDIIILLILLLLAGSWIYHFNKKFISDARTERVVDSLEQAIEVREGIIWKTLDERQTYLDSVVVLSSKNHKLAADYNLLKKRFNATIKESFTVPPDTAYERLQIILPDTSERVYPFSPLQVKSIYTAVISSSLKDSLITSLEQRSSLLGAEIASQRDVIRLDSVVISNLQDQATDYHEVLSFKNQQIINRDKKLQRGKWEKAGMGAGALILGILLGR